MLTNFCEVDEKISELAFKEGSQVLPAKLEEIGGFKLPFRKKGYFFLFLFIKPGQQKLSQDLWQSLGVRNC